MPTLFAYGDSWTGSDTHNTVGQRAVVQLASRMGWTLSNFAATSDYIGDVGTIASDGYRSNGVGRYDPGDSDYVLAHAGVNDLKNADTAQVRGAITHYLRHQLALFSAAARIEESTFTASGTWSNNSGNWSPSAGVNRSSTGASASLTATISTAGRHHLVLFGTRGSSVGAEVTVTQGGSTLATVVTDEAITALNSHTNNVAPMGIDLGTLGTTDPVVITRTGSTGTAFVDCLVRMSATPPTIILVKPVAVTHASYQNSTLLAFIRSEMDVVAAEFGSHVVVVDPNPGWNTATMLGADGLHPNDTGMTHIADAMEAALNAPVIELAGTCQTATAAFVLGTVLAASLAGTVQQPTAEFDLSASAQVSLAGVVQSSTGSFDLDAQAEEIDVALAGTAQTPTAEFEVFTVAEVSLAGETQPSVGAFSLSAAAQVTLAGETQAPTAEFVIATADRSIALSASARRATSTITLAAQPVLRLDGTVRSATAAFTVTTLPTVALVGTVQPMIAQFTTRAVTPVTPAPPSVATEHAVVVAQAFGAVTMQGTQPVYTISEASTPRARQQIVVDGIDVTYFRDVVTPDVTYTLLEPLLYGPGTLDLPQVSACFERPGYGELTWLRPGAVIEVHRVIDDVVVGTDYKGVVVAFDLSGRNLSVELGGEANGRAALRNRQPVIFPRVNDIGHQISDAVRDLGLSHYPALGTVTGIETMTAGGVGHLEHIQNLVAKAWTRSGGHWTVMPDEETGVYETHLKDTTTVHATAFLDDTRTVGTLRRDISEEPNRVYATGVTPQGQRVRFGVYPGLIQGPVPEFPGHMQNGDTGDGVRLLLAKLHAVGYLRLYEVAGGYDLDVVEAVKDLQDDAGLPKTGEVDEDTWNALYDLNITGTSLEGAHIEPAAQRGVVRQKNRSASGTVMGFNDNYDPEVPKVDLNIETEVGLNRSQIREMAKTKLYDSNDANWVGDIKFHTGALLRGNVAVGATVTTADVMDARELRPGMNVYLPLFAGGKLVHVSACQVHVDGVVTATVDTRFRDAMEVWEVIARNRESRNDPARRRNRDHRSSTIQKDSIGEWDEVGGLLHQDVQLDAGWNVFPVIAATEGTISRLRIQLDDPAEFVCGVFGRAVDRGFLDDTIGNPLTETGTRAWEKKSDVLEDQWILFSAGTREEPCGYFPGRKQWRSVEAEIPNPEYDPTADANTTGDDDVETTTESVPESFGTLTGKFRDDSGFAYRSWDRTKVYVVVYVRKANMIPEGRIMWPQLEAGA